MKHLRFIFLTCISLACNLVVAQTPFDSFSPETSRPMLVMEDEVSMRQQHVETSSDSMRYAVIVDIQQQAVYLADLSEERILAIAPLTEEMRNWLSVDPLSDKYPHISPYAYCGWNPIRFIDPDGETITITGEDGVTVTYVPGEVYDGNDSFVQQMWSNLDAISSTRTGSVVINELVNDEGKSFDITNKVAFGPNGLTVIGYQNGVRSFLMGISERRVEDLAHECFHAYQDLHGYGGASCANDVEAYIFEWLVKSEHTNVLREYSIPPLLMPTTGSGLLPYQKAYYSLCDGILTPAVLNDLSNGFKQYSNAGAMGIAEKYTTFSPNQQYLILNFWPW